MRFRGKKVERIERSTENIKISINVFKKIQERIKI
jgi:hypothetical protein